MSRMDYHSLRPKICTGDVILWQGNSLVSRLIRQWSTFSHASLVIRFRRGHRNRVFLVEALSKGLVLRSLSSRLEKYNGKAFWQHVRATPEERGRAWAFAINACSRDIPYDYGSLFRNIFGRVSSNARKYFCSEFVWCALVASGIVQDREGKAPRPGDLPSWIGSGTITEIKP